MLDTYMNPLDLTFLSIYRINGQEWPLLPGLLVQNPPKKLARGRDQDRLLIYLTLAGNVSTSPSEYEAVVNQVAQVFYATPGSLTSAMKTAVEWLNAHLVEQNMKSTGKGLYNAGALLLCTLRGNLFYIVQAGPTHVYHLANEPRHIYDPQLAGKGLGLSQTARMYFSQITLSPRDRLLFCAALPPKWENSINEVLEKADVEEARSQLLAMTDTNVSALIVKVSSGSGAMKTLRGVGNTPLKPGEQIVPSHYSAPDDSQALKSLSQDKGSGDDLTLPEKYSGQVRLDPRDSRQQGASSGLLQNVQAVQAVAPVISQPDPIERGQNLPSGRQLRDSRLLTDSKTGTRLDQWVRSSARLLAHSIQNGRKLQANLMRWLEKAIPRLLPEHDEGEPLKLVSRNSAIFLAIALPTIIFVVARIIYFQLGYEAQYKNYFERAQQAADQAQAESAPSALRVEWQAALDWLDKADQYQLTPNPEAQALRLRAQSSLDDLDKIKRVKYSLAFSTSLSKNLQVLRMAATETDIYLLDATSGSVLRGIFNGQNFDLDGSFQCGPGTYKNGIQVEKLIDIVALSRSIANEATILGIDAAGKLLYCTPGEAPRAAVLQIPGTGFQSITAISYDAYNLYLLDAPARAVWVYAGTDTIDFGEPTFFFGQQVPVMLDQAIGLAVNGDDLYLLHRDGHMATCTLSHINEAPTRCNDPALYIDSRPGYQGGMNLGDGIFSQIIFTSPPDPSVALLEPFTQSLFRFSPRALELQSQVLAVPGKENPLPKGSSVTAMAFSPNKNLFLFVNGQVFFGPDVP